MAIRSNPPAKCRDIGAGLRREEILPNPMPDLERKGCGKARIDMDYPMTGMIGIGRFPIPGPVALPAGWLTATR